MRVIRLCVSKNPLPHGRGSDPVSYFSCVGKETGKRAGNGGKKYVFIGYLKNFGRNGGNGESRFKARRAGVFVDPTTSNNHPISSGEPNHFAVHWDYEP